MIMLKVIILATTLLLPVTAHASSEVRVNIPKGKWVMVVNTWNHTPAWKQGVSMPYDSKKACLADEDEIRAEYKKLFEGTEFYIEEIECHSWKERNLFIHTDWVEEIEPF